MKITKYAGLSDAARRPEDQRKKNQWYSDRIKLKAVKSYLDCGNLAKVSRDMNIPTETIRSWKYHQKWWTEIENELIAERDRKKEIAIGKIVDMTLEQIEDRVLNGDSILDSRTGEIRNIPMKGKDIAVISKALHQQQQDLRAAPARQAAQQATSEMLADLAKQFAKIAGKKIPHKEEVLVDEAIEDVEYTEVKEENVNTDG